MKVDANDFYTHNDIEIDVDGTSLRGYLEVGYEDLIKKLGEPSDYFDDYKSDATWHVSWYDGDKATIYNWKNGKNYCGREGLNTKDITLWNVGGLTGSKGLARLSQMFSSVESKRRADQVNTTYKIGMVRGH